MKNKKRLSACIITLAMVIFLFGSVTAFADEDESGTVATYNGVNYTTLSSALEAANSSGGTVTLAADASLESTIADGVILEVGTYTLSVTSSNLASLLESDGCITVFAGGTVKYTTTSETTWIGTKNDSDALIQLTSGIISFDIGSMEMTLEGDATVPSGVTCYTMLGITSYPFDLTVWEDSTLTVNGTLRIISGTENDGSSLYIYGTVDVDGTLTVGEDGEVVIYEGGTLELPVMSSSQIEGSESGTGIKGDIVVYAGGALTYYTYNIFGEDDPMIVLDDGMATVNLSEYSITLNSGTAYITDNQKTLFVTVDGSTQTANPMSITVEDAYFYIDEDATLSLANSSSLTIEDDGWFSIFGTLEVHTTATFSGYVWVAADSLVVLYSNTAPTDAEFDLEACTAKIYSNSDVSSCIWSNYIALTDDSYSYTSISSGEGSLNYGYSGNHEYDMSSTTATCTEGGTETYTCYYCNEDSYTVEVDAYGHFWNIWDEYVWSWEKTDDGYTATLTFVCVRDESHTYTVTAEVTSETQSDGSIIYTATAYEPDYYDGYIDLEYAEVYTDTLTVSAEEAATETTTGTATETADETTTETATETATETTTETTTSTKTGDDSNSAFWIVLAGAAAAAVAVSRKRISNK